MSTHWLDCPFLTASQVRMVKQTIACPSRVLFFAVERDQDAPAQVKKKNPNLKAKFLFRICKINCIACICPWPAGVPLSECHHGGHIGGSDADSTRLGRRKPKRTPEVVINKKRTQVGARSTSTWRGFCNGGAGDALRLKQRKYTCTFLSGCETTLGPSSFGAWRRWRISRFGNISGAPGTSCTSRALLAPWLPSSAFAPFILTSQTHAT